MTQPPPPPQISYEMNSETGVVLAQLRDIPASPMYEVYISQLIRYSRVCAKYSDLLDGDRLLTQKLLKQGYVAHRLKSSPQIFYGRHYNRFDRYEISQMTMDQGCCCSNTTQ